jgi:hypothetical protein
MTSRTFNYYGNSRLRGGDNGSSAAITVCLIISVVFIAIMLTLMLMPVKDATGASTSGFARIGKSLKKKDKKAAPVRASPRARVAPKRRVRAGLGGAGAVANPRAVQHHAPMSTPPAPLPAAQLMTQTMMQDQVAHGLEMMPSSIAIGEGEMNGFSSEAGGVVASAYSDGNYEMDPGMMTTSSTTDITGLDTFMPNMGGGVGTDKGPIDPSTGLPLFTSGKLVRSQMLGGHGAGSFLRKVQDPLSGYKRLGLNMCGSQNARKDMEVRRKQFNAARLADPNGDPLLFNTSEWMY